MFSHSLMKKFLSFSIGNWVSLLIALISTPIITRIISPEDFGVFSLFTIILNLLLMISMLGTDQSYGRFYYEVDKGLRKNLLFYCLRISFFMLIAIALIILIFREYAVFFLFDSNDFNLIILLLIGLVMSIFNRFSLLVVRMEQRGGLYSVLQVTTKLLDFGILLLIYYSYFNIKEYYIPIISMIVTCLAVSLIAIILTKENWKLSKGDPGNKKTYNYRQLISYGFPLAITMIMTWVFQYTDRFFIKALGDYRELGLYAAAFKLVAILTIIQISFTTFWVPLSNQKYQENNQDRQFFSRMFSLVSFAMTAIGFILIFSKDLLKIMFGEQYMEAVYIFPMLVLVPVMYTISEISVVGINFNKKPKYHILISVLVCLVSIIGNLGLVPYLGAKGAAISTGVSYVFFLILRTNFGVKNFSFNINYKKLYFEIFSLTFFALISTLTKTNPIQIGIGIFLLMVIFFINYKNLKK
ncbi:hypothetical protein ABE28_015865 [Peribacillus muralis]|uniref:Uncharacterized protein n=2 Tax=Peribacillus muralis TaxID=264697 RepID=A0A1B3XRI0_9BACI|nr:hypothetical protein ABE28_015865 [Peribacillus muralis]